MKQLALYFSAAFCICFLLGLLDGTDQRAKLTDEDLLELTATAHSSLQLVDVAKTASTQAFPPMTHLQVDYTCNSIRYLSYDIDTGQETEHAHPTRQAPILSSEKLQAIFEGATGLKILELAGKMRVPAIASDAKLLSDKRTWLALGSISGFFAGRYIAVRKLAPCDSPLIIDKLRDPVSAFATRVRRNIFLSQIESLMVIVDQQQHLFVDEAAVLWPFIQKFPPLSFLIIDKTSLPTLRARFRETTYAPTAQDYHEVWLYSRVVGQVIYRHQSVLKQAFPQAHSVSLAFLTPVDPADPLAPISRQPFVISHVGMKIVLTISAIAGIAVALLILWVGYHFIHRHRDDA